ncbi:MAG: hypothetical protein GTO03_03060, partial [Planctomycetales bacterium]|nr:hypothetical protein [Planctomycetales bacterium]
MDFQLLGRVVGGLLFVHLLGTGWLVAAELVGTQLPQIQASSSLESPPAAEPAEPRPATPQAGPPPRWIWAARGGESCVLEKTFDGGGAQTAQLLATCDNRMVVSLNGHRVATSGRWEKPVQADVSQWLLPGKNTIRVEAVNTSGPKGFVLKLMLTPPDGPPRYVVTDKSWRATTDNKAGDPPDGDPAAAEPTAVKVLGKM